MAPLWVRPLTASAYPNVQYLNTQRDRIRVYLVRSNRPIFLSNFLCVCVCTRMDMCRYLVQPELHRVVRGPGHGDEGHSGGSENEGADPEGAAAASPAGHGGQAVGPRLSGPQQLQNGQGEDRRQVAGVCVV